MTVVRDVRTRLTDQEKIERLRGFILEWVLQTREAGFTSNPGGYRSWSKVTTDCFAYNATAVLKETE